MAEDQLLVMLALADQVAVAAAEPLLEQQHNQASLILEQVSMQDLLVNQPQVVMAQAGAERVKQAELEDQQLVEMV